MPRQMPGEPYSRVDSVEARQLLDANPDGMVVIDVRRDDEWVTGHATGAIHIPVDDLAGRMDEVPEDKAVSVYMRCRRPQRFGLRTGRRHGLRFADAVQHRRRHTLVDCRRQPHILRRQPVM